MNRLLTLCAIVFVCSLPAVAHADTVKVFNINYGLAGGTATGTVTLDVTTGTFLSANVTAYYFGELYSFQGPPVLQENDITFIRTHFADIFGSGVDLGILVPGTSLVGYTGGALCSETYYCSYQGLQYVSSLGSNNIADDPAGAASLIYAYTIAATPEPSSLVLLGTGLMAAIGAARRRYTRGGFSRRARPKIFLARHG